MQVPNVSNRKRQMAGGKQEVAGNASEVTIDDLQSGIAYAVSISASTKAGAGPSSSHHVEGKRKPINLPYSPMHRPKLFLPCHMQTFH